MRELTTDLAALYRSHGHIVLRRARQLLGNEEDARDMLQQIFTSLVDTRRFRGESTFTTYLYQATTNACLQVLRNRRTRGALLETRVAPISGTSRTGPEDIALVRELIATLPDQLARVIIHYFIDEMTHEEIAAQIGCTRRHVGNLVDAALAAMQQHSCEEVAS